jgi:winged helix DNA-binding protein
MGVPPNSLRYAAPTGTVLLRWDGSHQPVVWTVPPPDMDPWQARRELARRYLHIFGPATPASFARWAGIGRAEARKAFKGLAGALTPVRTPVDDDAWILTDDEMVFRSQPGPVAPARLLPSGDAYYLLWGTDREREWGDRWSVAPIGGRCLDRPLAQAFIGPVGRGRGRGVVTSAARSDYRSPERRRSATADCCTEPRTIWKLAGGPFRGQVDSKEGPKLLK